MLKMSHSVLWPVSKGLSVNCVRQSTDKTDDTVVCLVWKKEMVTEKCIVFVKEED